MPGPATFDALPIRNTGHETAAGVGLRRLTWRQRGKEAARHFEFEKAAQFRDCRRALKNKELFAVTE